MVSAFFVSRFGPAESEFSIGKPGVDYESNKYFHFYRFL